MGGDAYWDCFTTILERIVCRIFPFLPFLMMVLTLRTSCAEALHVMCGTLIGLHKMIKSLTPSPSPAERGVLEIVRLSNQVMMSRNICEPQGVSRISLPSPFGEGSGVRLFFTTAPSAFLTTSLILLRSPLLYI